jgi:hypothetical protein
VAQLVSLLNPTGRSCPDMARKILAGIRRVMDWVTVKGYRNVISVTSDQQIVSTEAGLAATIGFASQRPVGGEMFFLTAPLQKPL